MLPEWSRFITKVKLNRGLKESNFDQLYAYLKQHEVHANENRMMMERFSQLTNDPLVLVSNASNQKYPTQSSESPQSSNQPSIDDNFQLYTCPPQPIIQSISSSNEQSTQNFLKRKEQCYGSRRQSCGSRFGNAGGQNRGGNVNPDQAKSIKCYNYNGL
ncbi:hypothetical protein Tco_0298002, partial [Tanacetum coccineum]